MLSLLDRAERRFPARDGFRVTQSLIADIFDDLKIARSNPIKIAAKLGVPVGLVRYIVNELPDPTTKFTVHSRDGWGRRDLRDFVVCRKISGDDWDPEARLKMEGYRDAYDAGEIELTQGRDGNFIIQYAIPRKKKAKRLQAYFVIGEECDI